MTKEKAILEAIESCTKYHPTIEKGLAEEQVKERRSEGLSNKTPKKVTKSYFRIITDNLLSFFNLVLFGIAILMLAAGVYSVKYYGFLVILLANIAIGIITDIRARRLVDKLRLITDPKVKVVRDGSLIEISTDELVFEDVMLLTSGEQICADAIVINGSMNADESLITGESVAVKKGIGSQIYSGSYVKSGQVYAVVNRVGRANYAEDIQSKAKEFSRPKSELKHSCLEIFRVTGVLSIALGLAMVITYVIQRFAIGSPDVPSFYDFAISLGGSMVAMIPSGLYLLVSLALATGVLNLGKKHMNVQELYCIEMLARVDVICFDKTGTLTDGTIQVTEMKNYSSFKDMELEHALASLVSATKDDNGTAKAIKNAYGEGNLECLTFIPFDSEYKFSAATFKEYGTFVFGAPGFVDALSSKQGDEDLLEASKKGFRVVALYHNDLPIENGKIPCKNQLVALILFADHIKNDAKENIKWFRTNGVDIKVISGDNPVSVSQIAREVGVPEADKYVLMSEVKDEDIPELVKHYNVFGRVKPEQKALIVEALQKEGHKVAMTGDGVNDIIALKKADCSIAMASGASAARNVAHLISMDNDFSKLPDVVAEGRRVINNLQRSSSLFLGKTTFAVVLSFVFLIITWCGLPGYPYSTTNLFVWELCSIGGAGLLLSLQPSRERLSGSFMKNVLSTAIPSGIAEILCVCAFFVTYAIAPNFMSYQAAITCSTISFTLISYLVLWRICTPFDRYRLFVFVFLLVSGASCFLLDALLPCKIVDGVEKSFYLDLDYSLLTTKTILFMVCQFVVIGVIYFLMDYFVRKKITHTRLFKRKE